MSINRYYRYRYLLCTSTYEFEEQAINSLKAKYSSISLHHIGPIIPYSTLNSYEEEQERQDDYFKWLDSQLRGSVLYISQGSFISVSRDQTQEIIAGIKESGVRFLWVTRGDSDSSTLFKDNISDEMGTLVSWCNQIKVSSFYWWILDALWVKLYFRRYICWIAGVLMVTCPIVLDQLLNSKMIDSDMKIGSRVIKNDHLRKGGLVTRHELAKLVNEFMDPENEERKEMVARVKELQNTFRNAIVNRSSAICLYLSA